MNDEYRSAVSYATAQITEKKSRFIAEVFPVKNEDEALTQIAAVEKKYYDARHHCYAFVCGQNYELTRSSDNGEPSGTAGRPILEVLTGQKLTDTLIVVTRYFGGVLLGTGPLARAYARAAQDAIKLAQIKTFSYGQRLQICAAYAHVNAIERYLRENDVAIETSLYEADARYGLFVPIARVDQIVNDLTNICNGKIDISFGEKSFA